MKKYLMLFLVGTIVLTSGCSKEKFKSWCNNPKVVAGAVASGVCAGAYYFRESLGLKKKKESIREESLEMVVSAAEDLEIVEKAITEALS